MASWTMPYRPDAVENSGNGSNRDSGFYWQDLEGAADMQSDFFGQFVDLDHEGPVTTSASDAFHAHAISAAMGGGPESVFLTGEAHLPQNHMTESTGSSGVSTSDELDFLSNSSHMGPAASSQFEYLGRGSMSETDLTRLESISLHSPQKGSSAVSDPASPTPPNTAAVRKPKKFVEALSSTIRKATNLRKTRKPPPTQRTGSPEPEEHPQPLKPPKQRRGRTRTVTHGNTSHSPPNQQQQQQHHPASAQFIHGFCDDPFNENNPPPLPAASSMQYYGQSGITTPIESPGVKSEPGQFPDPAGVHVPSASAWQHHQQQVMTPDQWNGAGGEYITTGQEPGWWDMGMMPQGAPVNGEMSNHHRNTSVNLHSHAQHMVMPYEYAPPMADTGAAGLMIHMPQPRPGQPTVVNELSVNGQTHLPPPPAPPKAPATDRPHRPPRAKSSGARHLSCSPVRKQRAPSASPSPGQPSNVPRSRHSSGASVSSTRSTSGRLPGSMPGTPCSVRKRRSRDVSGGSTSISLGGDDLGGGGGGGGGGGVGFVNFTPNDGSLLMTGVAPSGSSKTKARREKEAQDRRRRLSEAALKAVAAAGGDVDKLLEQGFAF
ncbi:hypothetical protein JDV02_006646 [Purpureocillium takamizusanense]|uniref:Developmental regulatory protein wetA n=1 Tax=Purpureocillium takamizusanense TaxID=2060973 RepID=A0A9Q8VCY4_9HYPO|nr:uncharacterized protein JDV02_006646 [Purpureocillium takamizusanense]UNI20571.1 hypothetical protein JDV02_006646 [Purpureocillium takamizusanense]